MQTVVELSTSEYLEPVKRALIARGCWVEVYYDSENEIPSLLIKAGSAPLEDSELLSIEGIRSFKRARTVCKKVEAQAGMLAFGSGLPIIAGPCAVESLERLDEMPDVEGLESNDRGALTNPGPHRIPFRDTDQLG